MTALNNKIVGIESGQYTPKTQTIKKRTVLVFLPTMMMKKEWQEIARKKKMSLSSFIIDRVEKSIRDQGDREHSESRIQLVRKITKTRSTSLRSIDVARSISGII